MEELNYQNRVKEWLHECFGDESATSVLERCYRFFEESTELCQALGMPEDKARDLIKYVYGREKGEPSQEVGGVMVTLAALCSAADLDMIKDAETEYARVNTPEIIAKIRAKHNDKKIRIPESALPGRL